MMERPFFVLLGIAAMLGPAASCRCAGENEHSETKESSGAAQAGESALSEAPFKLANGLSGELVTGPCGDSAALVVLVNVGSDHDPAGKSGMARLAGRILATGAAAGRAERAVVTGSESTLCSVVVPGDKLADELDEVAAWMSKAAPTEADLQREKARLIEELDKLSGNDAAQTAMALAEESVQPARGGGKRRGIAREVESITLAELVAFWQAHFKPGNARITAVGRFDAEKVRPRIEAAFGSLPAGTPPVAREGAGPTVRGTLVMGDAPRAVAIAVPAPAASDPLFAPFLVLAARLMDKPAQARTWEVSYDPMERPELLLLTGPVGQAEQPEPAAGRMRSEAEAVIGRPLLPGDVDEAKARFRLWLDARLVDPALCAKDVRAFAIARARRAQVGVDVNAVEQALGKVSKEQLEEAAKLFDTKHSAAVIAGGAIR